jgi:hypothetical protein
VQQVNEPCNKKRSGFMARKSLTVNAMCYILRMLRKHKQKDVLIDTLGKNNAKKLKKHVFLACD